MKNNHFYLVLVSSILILNSISYSYFGFTFGFYLIGAISLIFAYCSISIRERTFYEEQSYLNPSSINNTETNIIFEVAKISEKLIGLKIVEKGKGQSLLNILAEFTITYFKKSEIPPNLWNIGDRFSIRYENSFFKFYQVSYDSKIADKLREKGISWDKEFYYPFSMKEIA
jgi:hypothetical protein